MYDIREPPPGRGRIQEGINKLLHSPFQPYHRVPIQLGINGPTTSDMLANFLNLPGELRNQIYKLLLVREGLTNPFCRGHDLASNLLCANKTILHEARSLLYGHNRFDLIPWNPEPIPSFLDEIGFHNANRLQHIRIDFPTLRDLEDDVTLDDDSFRILANIQNNCTNLKSLTMSSDSTLVMENKLDLFVNPRVVAKALTLVDAQLRAISSVQEIIVEVYDDGPSPDTRRRMESQGWTITAVERVEVLDCDRSLDDFEDDDYLYDDDDDDDYGIDDDSDYWRRAGD